MVKKGVARRRGQTNDLCSKKISSGYLATGATDKHWLLIIWAKKCFMNLPNDQSSMLWWQFQFLCFIQNAVLLNCRFALSIITYEIIISYTCRSSNLNKSWYLLCTRCIPRFNNCEQEKWRSFRPFISTIQITVSLYRLQYHIT